MLASIILPLSSPTLPLLGKPHFLAVSLRKSHICFTSNQNPIGEEARWQREEQRWLREEQRWLREEQRWLREESKLLQQITTLQLKIQDLQRLNSSQSPPASEIVANIAKLLQVVKDGDLGKNINRIADSGSSATPFVVEAAKVGEEEEVVVKEVISISDQKETFKKKETLRKGSEGDEVRAMQWEEPSRLSGGSKSRVGKPTTNCISCRGEGRVLCMECDGTGEPNIEPQFMEWVDEGLKCAYCEGLGFTTCDVCGGK